MSEPDDVHMEKWRAKSSSKAPPPRKGDHKVFRKAVNCYRKRLCVRIELPDSVKQVMRGPDDEDDWSRLELLRRSVARCILGERTIELTADSAADIASAMERQRPRTVKKFPDEIGPGCSYFPEGSRVLVSAQGPPRKSFAENRAALAAAVRKLVGRSVPVHTRPLDTIRSPPLDDFSAMVLRDPKQYTFQRMAREQRLTKEEALDKLLLALWDALFLDQCIGWSEQKVANLPHEQAPELGKWFMKGQAVGERPIFDGMCAMCGTLLYGEPNLNTSACSNKRFGPPVDRDGNKLGCNDCAQGKQPPCLLRPRYC